uniref:Uncharacterized protein n=1 Tax=Caenorhabditis japonica TaxID=281687 RepID=A0A8R1HX01_CAEJA
MPTARVRGRKRESDAHHIARKRRKEDEKENRLNSASTTPSTTSREESCQQSSNSALLSLTEAVCRRFERKPRKSTPVKWLDRKPVVFTKNADHLFQYYTKLGNKCSRGGFLTKNVMEKRDLLGAEKMLQMNLRCRERNAPPLGTVFENLAKIQMSKSAEKIMFTVNFARIHSWANAVETGKEITATSMLQSYTIFIDDDDRVQVIENGASIVPLLADKQHVDTGAKPMLTEKNVSYNLATKDKIKTIYLAVSAKRMVAQGKKDEGMSKRKTRGAVAVEMGAENVKYEPQIRYGCRLLFDKDRKIDARSCGIQHVILVDRDDDPQYKRMLGSDNKKTSTEWMSDVNNLQYFDQPNRRSDNSHLPRVIISTEVPQDSDSDSGEDGNVNSNQSKRIKESSNFNILPLKGADNEKNWYCQLRGTMFDTVQELCANFNARFPCFELTTKTDKQNNGYHSYPIDKFFEETISLENAFFYRPIAQRCFPQRTGSSTDLSLAALISVGANIGAARNVTPHSAERKFGLDFVQLKSTPSVLACVYKNRINPIIPFSENEVVPKIEVLEDVEMEDNEEQEGEEDGDPKKRGRKPKRLQMRREWYPVNNAKLYSDFILFDNVHPKLESIIEKNHEMQVVELPVSREETVSFNKKLEDIKHGRLDKKSRTPSQPRDSSTSSTVTRVVNGVDSDGRKIPTFAEIFFPHGKTVLYNMMQRFYYAEAGHRPGSFTAAQKARVLAGFITEHGRFVLENSLGHMFEKQVQLIATTTADWKTEHFKMAMEKYKEMRREFRQMRVISNDR